MKMIKLKSGLQVPIYGQGTWKMGQNAASWQTEIEALRVGIDLGMTLIDTAEYYGPAENLVGEAIAGLRKKVALVSKVVPQNASLKGMMAACEGSLRRLKTDYLDLYLLHWKGSIPISETLEAFLLLRQQGKILNFGVSNFDLEDMLAAVPYKGGGEIASNQVFYNLGRRGIEWDLAPWCQEHQTPIMAYSPLDEGRLIEHPALQKAAAQLKATPAQVALAWLLGKENVITIPKASSPERVRENFAALQLKLPEEILKYLDQSFPPPKKKGSLAVI